MTVEEIKAKLPEANVYELRPDTKYLVVVSRHQVSTAVVREMVDTFAVLDISAAIVHVDNADDAIRLLEIKS